MVPFGIGRLELPEHWEARSQITLLEPQSAGPTLPTRHATEPGPRANLVISRQRSDERSSADAMQNFVRQSAEAIPGLELHERDAVAFADGGAGDYQVLSFDAKPNVRLAQSHVFRLDDDVLTQIVITVAERRIAELRGPLLELAQSFRPG